jgi:hypothetical protein
VRGFSRKEVPDTLVIKNKQKYCGIIKINFSRTSRAEQWKFTRKFSDIIQSWSCGVGPQ